ncbi:MAG TPA: peptidylprolyl isomerase, partial [Candidatus Limnocylindrales bacterium]|nr:peptidylprolyl isomerase [Candidatus Limnocylindrales bacterium]
MADQPMPPSGALDTSKAYRARFKTERGEIVAELFAAQAPLTVENFVNLARAGFYDGTTFHRVIPGFMAQG